MSCIAILENRSSMYPLSILTFNILMFFFDSASVAGDQCAKGGAAHPEEGPFLALELVCTAS